MANAPFQGLGTNLGNLYRVSRAKTRSLSGENPTGAKGCGNMTLPDYPDCPSKDLGPGWKVRPCAVVEMGECREIANIEGPGAIQQIWMTPAHHWRHLILRIYWEDQEQPSVECPIGDFFACGWGQFGELSSLAVCVSPGSSLSCYWEMPFRKKCRMTVTNIGLEKTHLFYQINYVLTEVPEEAALFHAQFRRVNPLPYREVFTLLEGVKGQGQYVGTYMAWGANNNDWWGEGEIKFFLDGDGEFPTICGTGVEDYFCGSYGFMNPKTEQYQEFTTPYAGMHQVIRANAHGKMYDVQQRFGLYRWHIGDPIRFEEDLKVTMQALGWRKGGRYLPLQDDIASVAFWYQTLPTAPFPALPDRDYLEVV